jgi:hypothetical protein
MPRSRCSAAASAARCAWTRHTSRRRRRMLSESSWQGGHDTLVAIAGDADCLVSRARSHTKKRIHSAFNIAILHKTSGNVCSSGREPEAATTQRARAGPRHGPAGEARRSESSSQLAGVGGRVERFDPARLVGGGSVSRGIAKLQSARETRQSASPAIASVSYPPHAQRAADAAALHRLRGLRLLN